MVLIGPRCIFLLAAALTPLVPTTPAQGPPNVVVFLADDLGYDDVGPYDHDNDPLTPEVSNTPVLDQMATEGLVMTDFYADSSVCSPTRAALLTGRHAVRQGITHVFGPNFANGMSPSEITVAEILRPRGYRTGIVGKWHLGHEPQYNPVNQGFDFFYGVPYSNDVLPFYILLNLEIVDPDPDQDYLTQNYTREARTFIANAVAQQEPFFLFVSYTAAHVPVHVSPAFWGITGRGLYADAVYELDWSVGAILGELQQQGVDGDTLVVFASDNGACAVSHYPGKPPTFVCGSNYPLSGGKGGLLEGGIRVPFIARWPGVIPAGATTAEVGGTVDILPTVAAVTGAVPPDDREIDGYDLTPVWTAGAARPASKELHFFRMFGGTSWGTQEILQTRTGPWKQVYDKSLQPAQLFNVALDPGETTPIFDPALTATIHDRSRSFYCALGDPFEVPPPGNLARGRETWASSSVECDTSSEAVSGGPPVWRSSGAVDEWLMVDLEETTFLVRASLLWGGQPATRYDLEVSDDGASWNVVHSVASGNGGLDEAPLGVTARYLRVHATGGPGSAFELRELRLSGLSTAPAANRAPLAEQI